MRLWTQLLAVFVLLKSSSGVPPTPRGVTNEDIRDAILSVVHMLRSIEDKLERHEFRERAFSEYTKKNFGNLEKRIKMFEPIKGTISRFDERLASVETVLLTMGDREKVQLQKTFESIEDIQKNLPIVIEKLKSDVIERIPQNVQPAKVDSSELEKVQRKIFDKLENLTKNSDSIEKGVNKIQKDSEVIKKESEKSAEEFDRVKKQLGSSELLLQKYEHTLSEFNNKVPTEIIPIDYKEQKDWQSSFMKELESQTKKITKVSTEVESLSQQITALPDNEILRKLENETLDAMQELKDDNARLSEKSTTILDAKFKTLNEDHGKKHEELVKSNTELSEAIEILTSSFGTSYDQLKNDLASLGKVEQVMMQTADGVIDTKRRVEYGVHQILLEVANLVKENGEKINTTINERFDNFELSVLDGESGALANLTSKIGEEIDQVWRQIGIMHQQMSASTDTLNKLQNQTDAYVNGSLDVMGSMKGKVGKITKHMGDLDENLNYLLGRLSLVTQEFNGIKSGLGKALDEIRGTFKEVQAKVRNGPGPHQLDSNELDDSNNNIQH